MSNLLRTNNSMRLDTKADLAYRILKENIINGYLKPGTRLIQKKIAEELHISEIPVREAFKRLQSEGLITITPHSGAQVTDLDQEELEEVLAIRGVLEGFAARTALLTVTSQDVEKLKSILKKMEECIQENDRTKYGVLNQEFHRLLYSLSPYKRLQKMIDDLWYGAERSRSVFTLVPDRIKTSYEEHRQMIDALEAGDGDRLEQLVREHRRTVARHLRQFSEVSCAGEKRSSCLREGG